jgi:hypothetical protein
MDFNSLMISLLFGLVGMFFCAWGKNEGRIVPMVAGALLMVCPYFLSNVIALLIVCAILTAVPFVVREA